MKGYTRMLHGGSPAQPPVAPSSCIVLVLRNEMALELVCGVNGVCPPSGPLHVPSVESGPGRRCCFATLCREDASRASGACAPCVCLSVAHNLQVLQSFRPPGSQAYA